MQARKAGCTNISGHLSYAVALVSLLLKTSFLGLGWGEEGMLEIPKAGPSSEPVPAAQRPIPLLRSSGCPGVILAVLPLGPLYFCSGTTLTFSASGDCSGVTAGASGWSNPRLELLAAAFSGHPTSIPQAWVGVSAAKGKGACCPRGQVSAHGARVRFSCPGISSREPRAT